MNKLRKTGLTAALISISLAANLIASQAAADAAGSGETYPLPPAALADYNQGVAAMNKQDFATAAEKLARVVAADPMFAGGHTNYGAALAQLGKLNEAKAELLKATELKPDLDAAWLNLGTVLQSLGDTKGALSAYRKFMQVEKDSPYASKIKDTIVSLEVEQRRQDSEPPDDPNADTYLRDAIQAGVARWPKNRMPIAVHITPGTTVPGYRDQFAEILRQAFETWQKDTNGIVSFKFVDHSVTDGVECWWTDNPRKMISSAEGGHTETMSDSEGIIKVEITLLTQPINNRPTLSANYARIIDLHEIGHCLGILGHSRKPGDILYSTLPPTDANPNLSQRDIKTMIALYEMDASKVTSNPLDASKAVMSGDPNSIPVRVIRLNAEAQQAMKSTNLPLAIEKLKEALALDPGNELVEANLGACYADAASLATMIRNFPQAERYFKLAIPLIEKSPDKGALVRVLTAYSTVLKMSGKAAEAKPLDARIQALQGH